MRGILLLIDYIPFKIIFLFFISSQDLISNSPLCLPYNFCNVDFENLLLDQLIFPQFFLLFSSIVGLILY